MICIELTWPDRRLHPNARLHWAARARVVAGARADAHLLTRVAMGRNPPVFAPGPLTFAILACPPDRRRRDDDGIIASLKAARDGIADALRLDDHRFRLTFERGEPVRGGRIVVQVSQG